MPRHLRPSAIRDVAPVCLCKALVRGIKQAGVSAVGSSACNFVEAPGVATPAAAYTRPVGFPATVIA